MVGQISLPFSHNADTHKPYAVVLGYLPDGNLAVSSFNYLNSFQYRILKFCISHHK